MTADQLSQSQAERVREAFHDLDVDGSGKLSFDALLTLFEMLHVPTDADDLAQVVGQQAREANQFDVEAAQAAYAGLNKMALQRQHEREMQLRHAFKVHDRDQDGKVTAEELQRIMTEVTQEHYTMEEAAQLVSLLDTDGNGYIDVDELLGLVKSRRPVEAS
ncbi:hypothetical protein SYNPS1DRAFT_27188 [Syncephalis pseudoplumigaleata]|uniref:EF-hand domain-containing protein n=1 Tax=Syncephalis pseudoplumigaleata TaxID=1712513 RepID=A0A4P9Z3U4_9FUNG|nr:hypothetical protein SYNPS1DRAFT_27188 [Syncephalis pseudoplumigaleata]|eukprot:RKP27146.1 hypothetical protein SYNPS1DRAFT_27188 [Syncephalis pseudoplumigaleata]